MRLEQIEITRFRNLDSISIRPHPELNLLTGANGAGKSSVLEAIHTLSVGHSFRTRKSRELIQRGSDEFTITARFTGEDESDLHRCGLARQWDGSSALRLDYEAVDRFADVTRLLRVKSLSPDSHELVQAGPELRRQFLDWGVFHVEPRFIEVWRTFRRALRQRNQLLREQAPDAQVRAWDSTFAAAADTIDSMRKRHVEQIQSTLTDRLQAQQSMFHVELDYRSGWRSDARLGDLLSQNLETHRRFRTTSDGPHRAELHWTTDSVPLRQTLSRGQQKTFVYLVHLAQLDVLKQPVIVLCDDLVSELDESNALRIVEQLQCLNSQIWVSGVQLNSLSRLAHGGFHVERGEVEISV